MIFPKKYRVQVAGYRSNSGDPYGVFIVPHGSDRLYCLATDGICEDLDMPVWEHVSITVRNRRLVQLNRCPTWEQMALVKSMFWHDDETVMQLHPPKDDHINIHPYCLHLWRPLEQTIPLPPCIFVGPKTIQ
jgi:hypothetical protein